MKKTTLAAFGLAAAAMMGTAFVAVAQAPAPAAPPTPPAPKPMTFFITSVGKGDGANLGGLAGADAHCKALATAVGRGDATWHAYLSTQGPGAVNARDRIGTGPWYNAKGAAAAQSVAQIHGDTIEQARLGVPLSKQVSLNEKGELVKGAGDTPNQHDILTGTQPDGRAYPAGDDKTCSNWTSSGATGGAQVGHFDKTGGGNGSWNSSHPTRGGCGQQALVGTGGAGLLYCFAVD